MDIAAVFRSLEPFRQLEEDRLVAIVAGFTRRYYPVGLPLFGVDEAIAEIGLVTAGQVRLEVAVGRNRFVSFQRIGRGEFVGLESVLLDGGSLVRNLSEIAVRGYFCSRKDFFASLGSLPDVREYFMREAASRLEKAFQILQRETVPGPAAGDAVSAEPVPRAVVPSAAASPVARALRYIEQRFAQPIALDEIARVNAMSKSHFSRVFKVETGCTFKRYLNCRRIEAAKELLSRRGMTITEVAMEVGFNDFAYFSRTFHRCAGMTPSEYRKTRAGMPPAWQT